MKTKCVVLAGMISVSVAIHAQSFVNVHSLAAGSVAQVMHATQVEQDEVEHLSSLVLGAFEFPLSGTFEVERQGTSSMVLSPANTAMDKSMVITTRVINKPIQGLQTKQRNIEALESQLVRNWFARVTMRNGKVVTPFERTTFEDGTVLYWMSTEFGQGGTKQYHLNFTVTDGAQVASLEFEGRGGAEEAERKVRQYIVPLKYKP